MLRKAVEQSSVAPQTKPRFEARDDESVDPSMVEEGWVLNNQVLVARRFDVTPSQAWLLLITSARYGRRCGR
jgi:hypothetical protein